MKILRVLMAVSPMATKIGSDGAHPQDHYNNTTILSHVNFVSGALAGIFYDTLRNAAAGLASRKVFVRDWEIGIGGLEYLCTMQ